MDEKTKDRLLAGGVIGAFVWQVLGPEGRQKQGGHLAWFLNAVAVAEERKRLEPAAMQNQAWQPAVSPPAVAPSPQPVPLGQSYLPVRQTN